MSDLKLGILSGLAFTLSYAILTVPVARFADRASRRNVLALAVIFWSAMAAATGFAQGFWHLFASRVGIGSGEAGCVPPSHSMIVDLVPQARRSAVFGFYTAGQPLGAMLGLAVGGWLGALVGWRGTFEILGTAGIVLASVLLFTTKEPQRAPRVVKAILVRESFATSIYLLMRRRSYAFTLVGLGFASFATSGILQWLPSYFLRTFGNSSGEVGIYFGTAYGGGSLLGVLIGGLVGGRLSARDGRWPLWMASAAIFLIIPMLISSVSVSNLRVSMVLIFLSFAVLSAPVPALYGMIQAVSPPQFRALAVSLTLFANSVVGAGLGPMLIGYVSELAQTHGVANPLRIGIVAGMTFLPIPIVLYLWGSSHLLADSEAARVESGEF